MKISQIRQISQGRFSLEHIGEVFKDYYDETDLEKVFCHGSRVKEYVTRKRLFAGLAHEYGFKVDPIAEFLKYKDHSTVVHLYRGDNRGGTGHYDMLKMPDQYDDYILIYKDLKEQCETIKKFCYGKDAMSHKDVIDWANRAKPRPLIFLGVMAGVNQIRKRELGKPGWND